MTKKRGTRRTIRTAGEILSEYMVIELVRGPMGQPGLLCWEAGKTNGADGIELAGLPYLPIEVDPTLNRALLLPSEVRAYGSTHQLFGEISKLIARVTALPDDVVTQLAFFVFASWLTDCLPVAPFLWVTAPPTISVSPLLQVLRLLARRVILLNEPSPSALNSLPIELHPTIVAEVSSVSSSFLKWLRASRRPRSFAVTKGKLVDSYCAKVVVGNEPPRDPALAGFPLEISLPPSRRFLPPLQAGEEERIASEFQSKLLRYRLTNYARVTPPSFDLDAYTAATQDVAYALAAGIIGDNALQAKLVPFLKGRDLEIRVDRSSLLESIVLEALWAASHDSKTGVSVTDLTKSVNTILGGRGEAQEASPETVGWTLRALGFHSDYIPGGRKGLKLPDKTRATIHTLAAAYGVRALQQGASISSCSLCAAVKKDKKIA